MIPRPSDGGSLAIVPARGGSVGIPLKNLERIGGRTLLRRAVECGRAAIGVDAVVVSTDHPAIREEALRCGAAVDDRPAALAGSDVGMLPVLQHVLDAAPGLVGFAPSVVVLLQPTSPFRSPEHVDAAIARFGEAGGGTVVSVTPVPHRFTPSSLMRLVDGRLEPLDRDAALRRQDKPLLYARNGPAVLVVGADVLRSGTMYGHPTIAMEMPRFASLDIDDEDDLRLARAVHAAGLAGPDR